MLSLQQLAAALGGEVSGNQVRAPGPGHRPIDRSMCVWLTADGYKVHSFAGDDWKACRDHVDERIGAPKWEPTKSTAFDPSTSILFNPSMSTNTQEKVGKSDPPTAYVYYNADSAPRLRVNRTQNRNPPFWQEHWVDGQWQKGGGSEPKVPYRLPELLEAPHAPVLICEGEKDVDNVRALGDLIVTTSAGGANSWHADLNQYFKDRDVILVPDNDKAGEEYAADVYGHLKDVAASIKVLRLPGLSDKGDISDWIAAGGTLETLVDMLKEAPAYEEAQPADAEAPPSIQATPWQWVNPEDVQPREFLYGTHYVRQFLSVGFGAPGGGKSTKRMVEAIAMASGRPLLGVKPIKRLKVWYWNGEDPQAETDRRFAAICKHYKIKPEDIEGHLFANSGRDMPIVLAEQGKTGTTIAMPMVEQLRAAITAAGIDVLIIDPFVSCHRVTENDNTAIDAVAKQFSAIADATGCSVNLEHHVRKTNGNEATVDDGRGASSLVGAARAIEVLNKMTKAEADKLGLEHPWRYLCVDDGKANMAPLGERKWFKLESVLLLNTTELYPEGDSVGVVVTWTPPNLTAGVTGADFDRCAAAIRAGNWRADSRAKDWVGKAVAGALRIDLNTKDGVARVKAMLKMWEASGSIYEEEGTDEKWKKRKFVRVRDDEE
jgi:hypothetical protein